MIISSVITNAKTTYVTDIRQICDVWDNIADEITSLKFTKSSDSFGIGTHLEIWERS